MVVLVVRGGYHTYCAVSPVELVSPPRMMVDLALPVIEVVTFRANQRCMEDLELFKEVRDIVAVSTRCVRSS